jgi:hypothetical protein
MMKKNRVSKPYWEMNTQDLAAATAEFDKEFIADTFHPLTPEQSEIWESARRKGASTKPRNGQVIVSVPIEKKLLACSDALAKKMGISRARLIARGLKAVLAAEGQI